MIPSTNTYRTIPLIYDPPLYIVEQSLYSTSLKKKKYIGQTYLCLRHIIEKYRSIENPRTNVCTYCTRTLFSVYIEAENEVKITEPFKLNFLHCRFLAFSDSSSCTGPPRAIPPPLPHPPPTGSCWPSERQRRA